MVREVGITPVYERTRDSEAKTIVNVGGAGSSKSYSIAQLLIERLISGRRIGICRKTFPALRMTAYELVINLLKDYGIYNPDDHNKTNNTYKYDKGLIQFFSLDDPEKIKSSDFNDIWMEEANEFSFEDYTIMKLRLRSPANGQPNQMFLSLNPSDANGWIPTRLLKDNDVQVIHSTFEDNPYLSIDYIKTITDLINQDANFYKIYALGEWGLLQRRIYTNSR